MKCTLAQCTIRDSLSSLLETPEKLKKIKIMRIKESVNFSEHPVLVLVVWCCIDTALDNDAANVFPQTHFNAHAFIYSYLAEHLRYYIYGRIEKGVAI